jgi:RNA polymerase sigma-70 factor (ECF subfamily)
VIRQRPLATLFVASSAASVAPIAATDELEAALSALVARARAAWPVLAVSDEAFVQYIAARADDDARRAHLTSLCAEDLYLACACASGSALAIEVLDRRYLAELPDVLARTGVAPAIAADAVQSLRERLFVSTDAAPAKIAEYGGRGPLAGWLRVAGLRLASNQRRDEATRAAKTRGLARPAALRAIDPEMALVERRYGEAFNHALRDAFTILTAEERAVLRLHFVDKLNIERIGGVLGLSRATVGRRVIAGRERLLAESMRLLSDRLAATPTEIESLLGVLRSKLEVSLGALVEQG